MATVYLSDDLRHDRRVAVKVLHSELSSSLGPDRFLREIKLAARLNHPHIVPLYDSGEAEGFLYYVMPLVEGESLRDRARDCNRRAMKMEPDDPSVLYNTACVFAREEMPDESIETLAKALDNGFGHWQWLGQDPDLTSLQGDPRYAALLARKTNATAS